MAEKQYTLSVKTSRAMKWEVVSTQSSKEDACKEAAQFLSRYLTINAWVQVKIEQWSK